MKNYTITIPEDKLNLLHDMFRDAQHDADSAAMSMYEEATDPDLEQDAREKLRADAEELENLARDYRNLHDGIVAQLQQRPSDSLPWNPENERPRILECALKNAATMLASEPNPEFPALQSAGDWYIWLVETVSRELEEEEKQK